jgi:hypothetical protein
MVWNESESKWYDLTYSQIVDLGSNSFSITGANIPSWVTVQTFISPATALADTIAAAARDYIDEHGPDELFTESDTRYSRCSRFPEVRDEKPFRVGAEIASRIVESLYGASGDGTLIYQQDYDADALETFVAPKMNFLGKVGIYPL